MRLYIGYFSKDYRGNWGACLILSFYSPQNNFHLSRNTVKFSELNSAMVPAENVMVMTLILCSFEERLAAQRKEREAATAELGFKKQLTKEEKIQKKKERLAAIGKPFTAA